MFKRSRSEQILRQPTSSQHVFIVTTVLRAQLLSRVQKSVTWGVIALSQQQLITETIQGIN